MENMKIMGMKLFRNYKRSKPPWQRDAYIPTVLIPISDFDRILNMVAMVTILFFDE